ncbi:sensor histidine kinase [Rubrimonas sp.]|uniref:sensor histidine kinase n=1 Tax=Rubrimonas sp. TaxID=2036015 RepID=UPI002FDC7C1F
MGKLRNIWLVVAFAAFAALAALLAQEARTRVERAVARAAEFERLRGEIARLNEVLVSSARLHAATSDPVWRDRYYDHVAPLENAVAGALALADSDVARAALAEVEAANGALILMESQAMAFVDDGQPALAARVFASEGYAARRAAYRAGLERALSAGALRLSASSSREGEIVIALAAGLLVAAAGAIAAWLRARGRQALAERRLDALSGQGEMLRALLQDAPVAIALFDAEGACVAASEDFVELFGVSPTRPPATRAARAAIGELLALPPERPRADWIEGGAGPARWVWRETRDWRDARGRRIGKIAAAADFTDLRQLQTAYRAAHAQADEMGAVLEEARQEIYIFDAETLRFVHVNRGARDNLGYGADELARMTPLDIKPELDRADFEALIAPLREGARDMLRLETAHRRKDGSVYPAEIALSLRGDVGARRFVAIVDDISERRAREEDRARVTERLRLNEIELRAALEEADRASRLKSEFLARITHEIRTPLNGVLGGVALIRASDDPAVRAKWLDIVESSARALHQVIDDVLDIAQIEAGSDALEIESFDPVELAERALDRVRPAAGRKGLALRMAVADGAPYRWRGDARRLARVLASLLDNAVKFTDAGLVELRLGGGETLLRIEVVDTGPGVAEADREAIFERFRQADGSTTRMHGGVGLGLSIAREFTQIMGGRIGLRSAPGGGAAFWLEFAATPAAPTAAEPPASEAASRARQIRS